MLTVEEAALVDPFCLPAGVAVDEGTSAVRGGQTVFEKGRRSRRDIGGCVSAGAKDVTLQDKTCERRDRLTD